MDWNDFAKRLMIELIGLPARSFLIVHGPGGLPYVQVMRSRAELEAEAVGSAFLARPLSPREERRLTVLGWEPPDDPERENWWSLVPVAERSGRPVADQAERCAALASRMTAALRDVYGVRSPLHLVYQAGHLDEGGPLELPGLGLPRAAREGEGSGDRAGGSFGEGHGGGPGASGPTAESALADARERGDQDAYLALLGRAALYLPSSADPTYEDGTDRQYATAVFGDRTFVLAFTSPEAMDLSLRGQVVHHRRTSLPELLRRWPRPDWHLAVDPGLPSAGYLDPLALEPPPGAATPEPSGHSGHQALATEPERPSERPEAPQPPQRQPSEALAPAGPSKESGGVQARAALPAGAPGAEVVIMQKVVRPEHVAHYLEGGYDLVAGYVHRLQDVRDLNTPARLVRGLGLVYQGTPFRSADESIHVIRWPVLRPALLRTPLGGIDEWSMGLVPGGWVIEKAPFPGSGYAPGEGPAIPEFKIDSQRLPHGAEMYRIDSSGRETLVGGYDADHRRWLPRPGTPLVPPPRQERPERAERAVPADQADRVGRVERGPLLGEGRA
ncbi:SseB family protein [Actinomadura viridis]|uniref:SseB family protein n=1 Tax=Actinomadura viridis TaxID=58110 RepID=UPI0036AE6839